MKEHTVKGLPRSELATCLLRSEQAILIKASLETVAEAILALHDQHTR